MRRYADIVVHRQLWKTINNVTIEKLPTRKIFVMNFYSHFYKQVQRYSHLIKVASQIEGIIETDAFVTSIITNSGNIKLHIPSLDLDYDYNIINHKLKHLVEYIFEENVLTIKNLMTLVEIKIKLFDTITIKISKTEKSIGKINVSIVNPDIRVCLAS